jgi:hypothetical protein
MLNNLLTNDEDDGCIRFNIIDPYSNGFVRASSQYTVRRRGVVLIETTLHKSPQCFRPGLKWVKSQCKEGTTPNTMHRPCSWYTHYSPLLFFSDRLVPQDCTSIRSGLVADSTAVWESKLWMLASSCVELVPHHVGAWSELVFNPFAIC